MACCSLRGASSSCRCVATPYVFSAILIPFLILSLAALGLNILTGYAGQLSLGTAAFMAVGAFASYNFMLRVPGMPLLRGVRRWAGCARRWSASCSACRACASAASTSRSATLAAQFFVVWCLTKVRLVHQLQLVGRDHRAADRDPRLRVRHARSEIPARAGDRRACWRCREEHGALQHRPLVDGGARHGRRRRGDRHPADAHQAAGLRDQLVLLRRGRRALCLRLPAARSSRRPTTSTCRSASCS